NNLKSCSFSSYKLLIAFTFVSGSISFFLKQEHINIYLGG
ncbi:unnamed protein product, partial [marine sediment metagenome]